MGFFRIFPSADTWITNVISDNKSPTVRATGSNFGRSPTLRLFKLTGSYPGTSVELSRILMKFDLTELSGKIFDEFVIPSSSVSYKLKMFDYKHGGEVPSSYDISVFPVSSSWDEGNGIDDDKYRDYGYANWLSSSSTSPWKVTGSDYVTTYGSGSAHFDHGDEDFESDLTELVGNWLSSSIGDDGLPNHGVVVKFSASIEENSSDYNTKIFHGRESKYVDKLPYIEARWDSDVLKDNRGNFAYNQDSNLVFYNVIRGELTDGAEPIIVRLQDHIEQVSASYVAEFTASKHSTGIYTASFNISNTASFSASWYDIWFASDGSRVYNTGSFTPLVLTGSQEDVYNEYLVSIENLKKSYYADEEARVKVKTKKKFSFTHVLHTASLGAEIEYMEKMYYSIVNDHTKEVVVPFSTGSVKYTQLSYDQGGNYFNIDMNNFVPGFVYRILFMIDFNKYDKKIYDNNFLFKVI